MAHEIETHGDQAAFFSLRQDAWHGLGTVVNEATTVEDALAIAHMTNWNVRKNPLFTPITGPDGNVEYREVPDNYAVIRDNPFEAGQQDIFGVVGGIHTPVQNEEHAELLDEIMRESGAVVETAGSLKEGKRTFLTMKLPNALQVGGQDAVDTYIAALNAHDGSRKFKFLISNVRIVCANTQAMAEQGASASFAVRHTANSTKGIVQKAREALDLTFKYNGIFQEEADKMIDATLTNKAFDDIVRRLYPVESSAGKQVQERQKDRLVSLRELFRESDTMTDIRGTRWAGYQAVTEYLDWKRPVYGAAAADAITAQQARFKATLHEDSFAEKSKAFHAFAVRA